MIENLKVFTNDKKPTNDIIFLHGYLSSSNAFYKQKEFLQRDFNLWFLDLKGFGDNLNMEYPYSLNDYVDEVKEYAYKNSLRRPNVIAHSFGGRIAIKIASSQEDFFNKLVLTGCAGLKPKNTIKKFVKKSCFNILKPFVKKEKLRCFYSKDYLSLSPVMQQSFIKVVNEHLDEYISNIKNQTLLIFGKNDKQTPLYMAKKLNEQIINSKLIVFEDAGHFAFIDCPMKFNLEVKEFLLS